MADTQPLPNETALQYALRMGMNPTDAAQYIAYITASNGFPSITDSLDSYVNMRKAPVLRGQTKPVNFGPQLPLDQVWVGNQPGANVPGAVATPPATAGATPGTTPGATSPTTSPYPTSPINTGPPNVTLPFPAPGSPPVYPGTPNYPTGPFTPGAGGGGGAGGGPLPGYGMSQVLNGFGIPGFETNPLYAGGSWAGTVFNPPPAPTFYNPGLDEPAGSPNNPSDPYAGLGGGATGGGGGGAPTTPYVNTTVGPIALGEIGPNGQRAAPGYTWSMSGADDPKPVQVMNMNDPYWTGGTAATPATSAGVAGTSQTPGFAITRPRAYDTSRYLQAYGGKRAPYANIHEQLGAAFTGTPVAYPTFQWASPQGMQQGLRGMAPPGGWASMLGFTPGGST